MDNASALIPEHKEGTETNTESKAAFENRQEALQFFAVARNRLLSVNKWHDIAGAASAEFLLTDASGNEINRLPSKGDYLRINIPAPATKTGEGFDWVRIEAV